MVETTTDVIGIKVEVVVLVSCLNAVFFLVYIIALEL